MTIKYLKKSPKTSSTDDTKTREIVENILKDIEVKKEEACKELGKKFDKYDGEIIVSKEKIEEIKKNLDQKTYKENSPQLNEKWGELNHTIRFLIAIRQERSEDALNEAKTLLREDKILN